MSNERDRLGALPGAVSAGAALALSVGLQPSAARANTFEVTNLGDSGAGSLRQAIANANAAAGADVITFQAGLSGTITLTSGQLSIHQSLAVQGPGVQALTVDANNASRVFYLYNGPPSEIDVTISGLKIKGGNAPRGAGVYDKGENLTLDSVEVSGNTSSGGGAGGVQGSSSTTDMTIRNSVISGNTSSSRGGGIYLYQVGSALIQDTEISGNHATARGGGISLYDPHGLVTIERSTISGNTSNGLGGGIYLYGSGAAVVIRQSAITNNSAHVGGGMFFYDTDHTITVQNCTISGNQATAGRGGGIYLYSQHGGFSVEHCTIAGNSASIAGGGAFVRNNTFALSNSIVAYNTAPANADMASGGGSFDVRYSLIETPGTATITNSGGNITGQDPQLGALDDNGGTTQTRLPASSSPALEAGDPSYAGPPDVDQRGGPRVVGVYTDMGAVERNPGTLQCSAAGVNVDESAGMVALSVTRSGGFDGDASVAIATLSGTALQPADYTQSMATLQWSNQDSLAKTLNVPIIDENLAESSETFSASLSNTSGAMLGSTTTVSVTIDDDDAKPTISTIADQVIEEDQATGAIAFTIDDTDDGPSGLVLTVVSSNHALVADKGVTLGGSNGNRTVKVTPNADASGNSDITIAVSDGTNKVTETFHVVVTAIDDAPTVSAIDDQTVAENASTGAIDFTVADVDTDAGDLVVSATSSKHALLDDADITLGGSAGNRTITLKPRANKTGQVDVTISVSDGTSTVTTTFTLTVEPQAASDAGTSADAGPGMTPGSDAGGAADAGGGVGVPINSPSGDAAAREPDASAGGSGEVAGGAGTNMKQSSKDGCGCSTLGAGKHPSSLVLGALLGWLGLATRRRRTRGCPRCS